MISTSFSSPDVSQMTPFQLSKPTWDFNESMKYITSLQDLQKLLLLNELNMQFSSYNQQQQPPPQQYQVNQFQQLECHKAEESSNTSMFSAQQLPISQLKQEDSSQTQQVIEQFGMSPATLNSMIPQSQKPLNELNVKSEFIECPASLHATTTEPRLISSNASTCSPTSSDSIFTYPLIRPKQPTQLKFAGFRQIDSSVSSSSTKQEHAVVSREIEVISSQLVNSKSRFVMTFSDDGQLPRYLPYVHQPLIRRFLQKRYERLEVELRTMIEKLNLSEEASQIILQYSLRIITRLNTVKRFFKNKTMSVIAGAVILHASSCVCYPVTLMALNNVLPGKDRYLNKVYRKMLVELRMFKTEFNPIQTETIIHRIVNVLAIRDEMTLAACEFLYNIMSVKGFVKGLQVEVLGAAIVYVSMRLNGNSINLQCMTQKIGLDEFRVRSAVELIMKNQRTLLSNPALFKFDSFTDTQ